VKYYRDDWPAYVSAHERRLQTERALRALQKSGRQISPVSIATRAIATTFWGKAWCANLERYSDFANRLPRGRSYLRSGAVVDLQIQPGVVEALVSGSDLYRVHVKITKMPKARWTGVCDDCAGEIATLIELLQGRLSGHVMTRITREKTGLFPSPTEITFTCSCPDRASMCKHVAAVLYGIGARFDAQPELLFVLRNVNQQDLITESGARLKRGRSAPSRGRMLESPDLSALFDIDIAPEPVATPKRRRRRKGE
jgi:uncharacterized Zn finger protein